MVRRAAATERTRTRIEAALMALLATRPYAAIAVPDIAKGAAVSVRTVQRHFRSKDSLLVDACLRGPLKAMTEELSKDSPVQSAEERIRSLVQALYALYDRHNRECWALHIRAAEVPEVQQAMREANEMRASRVQVFIDRRPEAWCVDRGSAKQVILALTSYPAWRAFSEFTDFSTPEAATFVANLLCESLVRRLDSPHI
jgi:AcrR family transcriptional regulator